MDISTDMDALKTISNSIDSLNILKKKSVENLLTLLFMKKAKLIELRDTHMIFSAHIQIKALERDIQNIINGKCFL